MPKPKLKPCPWCGSECRYVRHETTGNIQVSCGNLVDCNVWPQSNWFNTQAKAAKAWNTRRKPRRAKVKR